MQENATNSYPADANCLSALQGVVASPPHPDQLYTQEQTALRLCIKPEQLRKGRQGKAGVVIPFVKLGRLVRYREKDIAAYLDKMTANYASEARYLANDS